MKAHVNVQLSPGHFFCLFVFPSKAWDSNRTVGRSHYVNLLDHSRVIRGLLALRRTFSAKIGLANKFYHCF